MDPDSPRAKVATFSHGMSINAQVQGGNQIVLIGCVFPPPQEELISAVNWKVDGVETPHKVGTVINERPRYGGRFLDTSCSRHHLKMNRALGAHSS